MHALHEDFVQHVEDQKDDRYAERAHHALAVRLFAACLDADVSSCQQDGCSAIQQSVDRGECFCERHILIQQPEIQHQRKEQCRQVKDRREEQFTCRRVAFTGFEECNRRAQVIDASYDRYRSVDPSGIAQ